MTTPKKPTAPTTDIELSLPDQDTLATEALHEKLADAELPGFQVEFDPDEAERAGAFVEDALSLEDALDSSAELVDEVGEEKPMFLDDEGPSADIPTSITRTNAYELYGLKPGERVSEAIARHNTKER